MGIQSEFSAASTYAQGIMDSANSLLTSGEATKDDDTTLQGQANASTGIDKEYLAALKIGDELKTFVSLIHGTAAEFAAIDHQLSQQLTQSSQVK